MTGPVADQDLALADLHLLLDLGMERAARLCTRRERSILAAMASIHGPPGRLLARLSCRARDAFVVDELVVPGVPDAHLACDVLVKRGLLTEGAPWSARLAAARRSTLSAYCKARGLPRSGRREALIERLLNAEPLAPPARMVGWPHRRLLDRIERFATLRKRPDRGLLVAERLGYLAWPSYPPTQGAVFFEDREALLAWESLWEALCQGEVGPEGALVALREGRGEAPGGLSLRRRLCRVVQEHAEAAAKRGDYQEADGWLDRLQRCAALSPDALAVQRARYMERSGRPEEALAHLSACREEARPDRRLAIARAGRRIARSIRRSWAPEHPLREPKVRRLDLMQTARGGSRPRWRVEGRERLVEGAVAAYLLAHGRRALRCEGGLVRTLFALLFAEAMFAPIPGALPVPRLSGPLDLGGPRFSCRRPRWIFEVLDEIAAGRAPCRLAEACERYAGVRLAGVSMALEPADSLVEVAQALGPEGLRALLLPLLREGLRAAAGLPDLLVLPGPRARLEGAFPSTLRPELCLVEVKGPGDSLRDAQRIWIDRLLRAGLSVEVWRVRPSGPAPSTS
ncbi:MAG: hypothetical protein EA397_07515 [Deltaproteobacteria bacterium]|nr:MAG: hypothetical protein EA397_07515 [Deltaproteobacteria bacterium]